MGDVAFAVWDPVSPVTSPFALANTIKQEVNSSDYYNYNCMTTNITLKLDLYESRMITLLNNYETAKGASGDVKRERIDNLIGQFETDLVFIFGGAEKLFRIRRNATNLSSVISIICNRRK
eukprot:TRINITY_DN8826_c0_g1_i1.p1 TRINITY_DN8826_c0_g1~~TRINITY_DN8826_c0_g1_i1.p1  ORF type:complete len:136 (-),score=19.59 TRINITY_DN8826_c0_g1_i1:265-627(-)